MTAAAITSDILCKNECPIQGHTFLPNNKNGIMLFHIMMMSMKTAWKWESVNLSSMEKRKVSTFLANEEKKRLLKSGKDRMPRRFFKTPRHFSLNTKAFLKNALVFSESLKILFPQFCRHTKQIALCLQVRTVGIRMGVDVFTSHKFPFTKKNFIFTP